MWGRAGAVASGVRLAAGRCRQKLRRSARRTIQLPAAVLSTRDQKLLASWTLIIRGGSAGRLKKASTVMGWGVSPAGLQMAGAWRGAMR
jgi:hypothetical protein